MKFRETSTLLGLIYPICRTKWTFTTLSMLSAKRDRKAAKRFLKKALGSKHNQIPRVITVDKNPAYPPVINELKNNRILPQNVNLRQIKYLNNIVAVSYTHLRAHETVLD